MTLLKRFAIAVVVVAVMGVLLEIGLRTFMPSFIEGGARVALRVPKESRVTVEYEGSMALNALRWRIADVVVVADDVPLSDDIRARTTLRIESLPLVPVFGKLRGGTAEFVVPAEQLGSVARLVSRGLAEWGEMRDGELVGGGVLTDAQFDLPYSPAFEVPYEMAVQLGAQDGGILVTPTRVSVSDPGPIGAFLSENMGAAHTVCIADRLPEGAKLSGVSVAPSGEVTLRADLSEGLLSNPSEKFPGTCGEA